MQIITFALDLDTPWTRFLKLDPMVQAVVMQAAAYSCSRYDKGLLITSLDRPTGSHSNLRCIDVDVCDGAVYEGGVLPSEAERIVTHINGTFKYDPVRPGMFAAYYGHRDRSGKHDNHIHFQVHPRTTYI